MNAVRVSSHTAHGLTDTNQYVQRASQIAQQWVDAMMACVLTVDNTHINTHCSAHELISMPHVNGIYCSTLQYVYWSMHVASQAQLPTTGHRHLVKPQQAIPSVLCKLCFDGHTTLDQVQHGCS